MTLNHTDAAKISQLKTAFVYNFVRFSKWPEGTFDNNTFVIGHLGSQEKSFIKSLEKKTFKKNTVKVIAINDAQSIETCHLIYISSDGEYNNDFLKNIKTPTLLVGDKKGFIKKGGMIEFVNINNKIRFKIDQKRAESLGLKISAQLLKLAVKDK